MTYQTTFLPIAHSALVDKGIPEQPYGEHVPAVRDEAVEYAARVVAYMSPNLGGVFKFVVARASEYHDLGKLVVPNQEALYRNDPKLPVNHVDAGVAHLIDDDSRVGKIAALIALGHHIGIPALDFHRLVSDYHVRPLKSWRDWRCRSLVDANLAECLALHREAVPELPASVSGAPATVPTPLYFRMAMSCLADADHFDTARNYGKEARYMQPAPRWEERLALLDVYVAELAKESEKTITSSRYRALRHRLRQACYEACRNSEVDDGLNTCVMPVGAGKTTAVLAYLLRLCIKHGLRRIFIVVPYTSVIDQTVRTLRKAVVELGVENPQEIVVAHHHRADFISRWHRKYAVRWQAPIVVTTAVQFFETLASNRPSQLRKLHNLAGSAIFLDESHGLLPPRLWPVSIPWLQQLRDTFGCKIVLSSGTPINFHELDRFCKPAFVAPSIIADQKLAVELTRMEARRGRIIHLKRALSFKALVKRILAAPGPRIVVMNTVQSAAVVAKHLADNGHRVFHLSTGLSPRDRGRILKRIETMFASGAADWTLVGTSCIEAGMDFSFHTGFRERFGLCNLLQLKGRVSRSFEFGAACVTYDFYADDPLFRHNPLAKYPSIVLSDMLRSDCVGPEHCTEAMFREILERGALSSIAAEVFDAERRYDFPETSWLYKVIAANCVSVVSDPVIADKVRRGEDVPYYVIQDVLVRVDQNKITKWGLEELVPPGEGPQDVFEVEVEKPNRAETYRLDATLWAFPANFYDPELIGFMKGVLDGVSRPGGMHPSDLIV